MSHPYPIHGWRKDIDDKQAAVVDEETFQEALYAVTHTACGKKIGGRDPIAIGPRKDANCPKCLHVGCKP